MILHFSKARNPHENLSSYCTSTQNIQCTQFAARHLNAMSRANPSRISLISHLEALQKFHIATLEPSPRLHPSFSADAWSRTPELTLAAFAKSPFYLLALVVEQTSWLLCSVCPLLCACPHISTVSQHCSSNNTSQPHTRSARYVHSNPPQPSNWTHARPQWHTTTPDRACPLPTFRQRTRPTHSSASLTLTTQYTTRISPLTNLRLTTNLSIAPGCLIPHRAVS